MRSLLISLLYPLHRLAAAYDVTDVAASAHPVYGNCKTAHRALISCARLHFFLFPGRNLFCWCFGRSFHFFGDCGFLLYCFPDSHFFLLKITYIQIISDYNECARAMVFSCQGNGFLFAGAFQDFLIDEKRIHCSRSSAFPGDPSRRAS